MKMGDNREAWAIAAVRKDGSVAGLRTRDLTSPDDDVLAVEWSARAGALFVFTGSGVVAVARSRLGL